jgi:hypothetical protein
MITRIGNITTRGTVPDLPRKCQKVSSTVYTTKSQVADPDRIRAGSESAYGTDPGVLKLPSNFEKSMRNHTQK